MTAGQSSTFFKLAVPLHNPSPAYTIEISQNCTENANPPVLAPFVDNNQYACIVRRKMQSDERPNAGKERARERANTARESLARNDSDTPRVE